MPGNTYFFAEHQFRQGTAVGTDALRFEQLHNIRVRRGLDGEIFFKIGYPRKSVDELADISRNSVFIVNVKWCGM